MRIWLFVDEGEESIKAQQAVAGILEKHPEVLIRIFGKATSETWLRGVSKFPTLYLEDELLCEGSAPTKAQLTSAIGRHRPSASKAIQDEHTERDEMF